MEHLQRRDTLGFFFGRANNKDESDLEDSKKLRNKALATREIKLGLTAECWIFILLLMDFFQMIGVVNIFDSLKRKKKSRLIFSKSVNILMRL